jgi:hypothetical protein
MVSPGSFLCQVMCCAQSPLPTASLSSLEEEEGEGEIPIIVFGRWYDHAAMPLSPPTNNGIDYEKRAVDEKTREGGQMMPTSDKSYQW